MSSSSRSAPNPNPNPNLTLALTLALTLTLTLTLTRGTYFEHIDKVVDMEQGHVTFRPGSVRHAGAAIAGGLRYIIGGFIAVWHVT